MASLKQCDDLAVAYDESHCRRKEFKKKLMIYKDLRPLHLWRVPKQPNDLAVVAPRREPTLMKSGGGPSHHQTAKRREIFDEPPYEVQEKEQRNKDKALIGHRKLSSLSGESYAMCVRQQREPRARKPWRRNIPIDRRRFYRPISTYPVHHISYLICDFGQKVPGKARYPSVIGEPCVFFC